MRYALHDMSPQQFENLIIELCHDLLGAGVQEFSTGPDGGRDAVFEGTAQAFPSTSNGLKGRCIIQAKHSSDPIGKYSDKDFSGTSASSTLSEEIPRIQALSRSEQVDHYLLFSNRRCSTSAKDNIVGILQEATGITSIHVFGIEDLERYIKRGAHLKEILQNYLYDSPLRASPDELAEVIIAISKESPNLENAPFTEPPIERIRFKDKNELNGLSEEYAKHITTRYLKDFRIVSEFLANPRNETVLKVYNDAIDEFQAKLITHRACFRTYDSLLNTLLSTLIERDGDLKSNKRITRVVFYYMYWVCDIGRSPEDE